MYFSNFSNFFLFSTAAIRATPTTGPFVPTADNLIFNTTVPQGVNAVLGWVDTIIPGVPPFENVFDGSAKNITMFYTPPGGVEKPLIGFFSGPSTGFCGVTPGSSSETFIDSSVLGTYECDLGYVMCPLLTESRYTGRWVVEFGQSTDPDAPIDPKTGCGPLPFTTGGVEFVRTWEVVAA
ncbi:hypothetical protein C8R45DRAFT_1040662 [Mycena sanguinolenta]|nr:hypothetical protein C8R45DRAFT_1040662 [Mycena sanguinolenta]